MQVLVVSAAGGAAGAGPEMRGRGWQLQSAGDVPTALMAARRHEPDAIVTTARLPGGGGGTLVTRLRGLLGTALTPIVALVDGDVERAGLLAAGASRCVDTAAPPAAVADAVGAAVSGERAPAGGVPSELLAEPTRIDTIRETGVSADEPDRWLDEITAVVTDLLAAPTSLVSLVGTTRQEFPGRTDTDRDQPGPRQTPLSHSFCRWAVTARRRVVVEDSHDHAVLRSNRAVEDDGVRAYVGIPLEVAGATVGTLCALDYQPRRWDDRDLRVLELLADLVRLELTARVERESEGSRVAVAREGIDGVIEVLRFARPGPDRRAYEGLLDLLSHHSGRLSELAEVLDLPLGEAG